MNTTKKLEDFNLFAIEIFDNLKSPSETLIEAMKYSFFSGGKRIRAQFVYAIGEAFNIDYKNCHIIAFAIELIHTYSLIHDDLPAMDDDCIRRGKPTCHIKYGEATAILAGDALQALAFEFIQKLDIKDIKILKRINILLAQCCGLNGMVAGQQLDLEGEKQNLEIKKLEIVHINKTARMFSASILIPYYLSNNFNENIQQLLSKLSLLIGLCFQVKDDILDVNKTTKELGKTSAKDIASCKSTYVSLMGLEGAIEYLNSKNLEIKKLTNELKSNNIKCDQIEKLINLVIHRDY